MASPIEKEIAALARRQRGYVTRSQLMKLGLGAEAVRYRIKSARLIPVYAGVYAVGHLPTLPQDRAAGALLACGPGAVLSHSSAGSLWGIFTRWELPFDVISPADHRRKGIRLHRVRLERRDVRRQLGLPVTSPARTLLDLAPRLRDKTLRRAVHDLRRPGHLRMPELADIVARFPRHPGAARLSALLDAPPGQPTRSTLEDDFFAFSERFGFPRPLFNVKVAGREVDVWFPEERVIVELDGWAFHNDRGSFEDDRDRDATALALGIPTIRITQPRLMGNPEREAERLWKILRSRRTGNS